MTLHSRVIGSSQYLTERNIWVKFNENRPKGSGGMERTHNLRINPYVLTCVLDLESRELCHVLCTPSRLEEHLSEV